MDLEETAVVEDTIFSAVKGKCGWIDFESMYCSSHVPSEISLSAEYGTFRQK